MSSLIFAQAKSIRNKAKKEFERAKGKRKYQDNGWQESMTLEEEVALDKLAGKQAYDDVVKREINEFKEILIIARQLHDVYVEETSLTTSNCYWVTIRPNEKLINFEKFKIMVFKYLNRLCIDKWTMVFEQVGKSLETLGEGFHCHTLIWPKQGRWRSHGEILRDTQSTFAKCTAGNCIEIIPTRNPHDIINKYLVEHTSKDGHKDETTAWDILWREKMGLNLLYESDPAGDPDLSSSPVTGLVQTIPLENQATGSNIVIWD